MEQEIKNKVAVITGGARGINFAIAEEILKKGAKNVIILDINAEKGNDAVQTLNSKYGERKAEFIKTDISKNSEKVFKLIIEKYKTVDILVNGAGIVDEVNYRKMFDVNTIALIEMSILFFSHMRKDKGGKGGSILNISSVYGYMINPDFPIYKATKFAVVGFSKSIGHIKNYEVTGVKVVALCPGYTITDLIGETKAHEELQVVVNDDVFEEQAKEDVAKAAAEVISKVAT